MTQAFLLPNPKNQFFDNNGVPLASGQLYSYAAGSNTPLATYTDSTGATANANPVVLDSAGRANVWLTNAAYKFVLEDVNGVTIWTEDNVQGVGYLIGNTTINGTLTVTGAATFDNNVTIDDNLTVDGTTALEGVVTLSSELDGAAEVQVTAAATIVLNNIGSNTVQVNQAVSGSVNISAMTLANGSWRMLRFTGVNTLVNSTDLVLSGGQNITTAAGDRALVYGEASGVVQVIYFASSGAPLVNGGTIAGTANAITATAPGYALLSQTGVIVEVGVNNTGATTLDANGTGVISVLKSTASGLVALAGGELQAGAAAIFIYNGTNWILTNPANQSPIRAWGTFVGTTSPSIIAANGITGITRAATGVYVLTLASGVLPDTNCAVFIGLSSGGGYSGPSAISPLYTINSATSITIAFAGLTVSVGGVPYDVASFSVQVLHL